MVVAAGTATADAILDAYGTINGQVISSIGGVVIVSSDVEIYNSNDELVETVLTDSSGNYTAGSLSPGSYKSLYWRRVSSQRVVQRQVQPGLREPGDGDLRRHLQRQRHPC